MPLMLSALRRSRSARMRLPLALAVPCLFGLPAAARADVPVFGPTLTPGRPVSTIDFPHQTFVPGHITVVPDPDGSGVAVLKYTVDNTDQPYPGANPRADLLTRPWYTEGSTLFTSIPVKIPSGLIPFRNSGSSFYQFAEAKDTAASSPSWGLYLMADPSGRDHWFFGATPEIGTWGDLWLGPVVDGGWHTFVVAGYYTAARGQGWLELYMDGQPVTFNMGKFAGQTRATGVTTILDGAAGWPLDINSYRSSNTLAGTLTTYHGAPKIGLTLASVIGGPAVGPQAPPSGSAPAPPPVSILASPRRLRAAFTTRPHISAVGQRVRFDATVSTGRPVRYVWSIGRRRLGTRPTLTYRFRSVGTKHVRLTITAASGETSSVRRDHVVIRQLHRRAHHHRVHHRHHRAHHHRPRHPHHRAHHHRGHDPHQRAHHH